MATQIQLRKSTLAALTVWSAFALSGCTDPVDGYFDKIPSEETLRKVVALDESGGGTPSGDSGTGGNGGTPGAGGPGSTPGGTGGSGSNPTNPSGTGGTPGTVGGGGTTMPPTGKECLSQTFTQPADQVTRSVDILFVIDTSGSLDSKRKTIASEIQSFVLALRPDVDYRVGVLLGHAFSSYAGKLYKKANEPVVLNSNSLTPSEITTYLTDKVRAGSGSDALPSEGNTDGGEAGLISLMRAVGENLQSNRTAGFFRTTAALAVIFVADENDVCFPGAIADDSGNEDKFKTPGTNSYKACEAIAGTIPAGSTLQKAIASNVTAKLTSLQAGRPLQLSGIVYLQTPSVRPDGEDEKGLGYLEVLDAAPQSVKIDLASKSYASSLQKVGDLTQTRLDLLTEFKLNGNVDPSTIQVLVDNKSVASKFFANTNLVGVEPGDAGRASSQIIVNFCRP